MVMLIRSNSCNLLITYFCIFYRSWIISNYMCGNIDGLHRDLTQDAQSNLRYLYLWFSVFTLDLHVFHIVWKQLSLASLLNYKMQEPFFFFFFTFAGSVSNWLPYLLGLLGIFTIVTMFAVVVTEGCRKIKLQYYGFKLASASR